MLDYNRRPTFAERVNTAVDQALTADQATRPPRDYLGGSRLGHACERALQFEFTATPKDDGQDFSGQTAACAQFVFGDQFFQSFNIRRGSYWLDIDHVEIAEGVKELVVVQYVGDSAAHAGGEVASGFSEDDHCSPCHVLTTMIADTLYHGYGTTVADGKALANHAADEHLA